MPPPGRYRVAYLAVQGEPAGRPRPRFAGVEESPASTGQGAGQPPVGATRRTVPQRADRHPARAGR